MKYSGSSYKRTITNGSVCSKCQRTFNGKKHHDRGSRACVPSPVSLAQIAAPGTLILLAAAARDRVIEPAPAATLGHDMSIFGSTLDAQHCMSVSSTEVENILNDFPKDDRKSAVLQDDDVDVHYTVYFSSI
jgi:hypothetical protein